MQFQSKPSFHVQNLKFCILPVLTMFDRSLSFEQPGGTPEPRFDLLEEERQIPDSGEFENKPEYREDVIREWETEDDKELPEQGG